MDDLNQKITNGLLIFYGYSYKNIPEDVKKNHKSKLTFFFKTKGQTNRLKDDIDCQTYVKNNEIGQKQSDIVFLDQDAVKGLFNNYPPNCKYVLVNCARGRYFFWIIVGLLRRVILRKVRFLGIKTLSQNGRNSFWLVLARKETTKGHEFRLSTAVGIEGFLKYLYEKNVDYVVPRHFDTLPALHRPGGDLDLIVSDKDEELVKNFLIENTGSIRVDVWSVSRSNYNGITYMPPHLAQNVVENSVVAPSLAKVPNDLDAFKCLVFHVLYHKGFGSRIDSQSDDVLDFSSYNDYLSLLKKRGRKINIKMEYSPGSLDEYMASVGWRPDRKMLSKIAKWNEWVRLHHFDKKS
jgi:hypothetical protein